MISDCLPHQVQRLHDELAHASSKHRQLTAHAQAAEATFAERVRNSHAEQEELRASIAALTAQLRSQQASEASLRAAYEVVEASASASAAEAARLATVEARLLATLTDREQQLHVAIAQLETHAAEIDALRRGSSAHQLSARYDEQIEMLQRQVSEQAARDAQALYQAQAAVEAARAEAREAHERARRSRELAECLEIEQAAH